MVRSYARLQQARTATYATSPPGTAALNETDTDADTGSAGCNWIMLHASPRVADVYGFSSTDTPTSTSIPIGTCATAYTSTMTGETYILVHPEMLYFGPALDHTLLNPNQIRSFGMPAEVPEASDFNACLYLPDSTMLRVFRSI